MFGLFRLCLIEPWKPYIIAGIFEKHKLLFSFQITIKLEQDQNHVKQDELDFFIKVGIYSANQI